MTELQPQDKPGKGLFGWLGRQVGYVARAVRQPVGPTKSVDAPAEAQRIYHEQKVREQPMPGRPGVVLRRTTIDEAILQQRKESRPPSTSP